MTSKASKLLKICQNSVQIDLKSNLVKRVQSDLKDIKYDAKMV